MRATGSNGAGVAATKTLRFPARSPEPRRSTAARARPERAKPVLQQVRGRTGSG